MTTLFDGMATLGSAILGGVVTVVPAVGVPFEVQAIFRQEPVEVLGEDDRSVLDMSATLSATAAIAALLSVGDEIRPDATRRFKIVNSQPNGSPASDAETVFELEEVTT